MDGLPLLREAVAVSGDSHAVPLPVYPMALTFSRAATPSTSRAVDDGVDKVCKHAGHIVRRLGKYLWKWQS
jgi:hypothetical protein